MSDVDIETRQEPSIGLFNPTNVARFYDSVGLRERDRLCRTPYGNLLFDIHLRLLRPHLTAGQQVIDVGCGGGVFSVELAAAGCEVTLVDISPRQLEVARLAMVSRDLMRQLKASIQADVCDLRSIADNSFDLVICFGGVLNYVIDGADQAVRELGRILRPRGKILLSVISRWGGLLGYAFHRPDSLEGRAIVDMDRDSIERLIETGNLGALSNHPPRRFYESDQFRDLLARNGLHNIHMSSAPVVIGGCDQPGSENLWRFASEVATAGCEHPGLLDSGHFLLAIAEGCDLEKNVDHKMCNDESTGQGEHWKQLLDRIAEVAQSPGAFFLDENGQLLTRLRLRPSSRGQSEKKEAPSIAGCDNFIDTLH